MADVTRLDHPGQPPAEGREPVPWHALEGAEVVDRLGTDGAHGLRAQEAMARLESYGGTSSDATSRAATGTSCCRSSRAR